MCVYVCVPCVSCARACVCVCVDCFYIALFSALKQTALACDSSWVNFVFIARFGKSTEVVYL